MKVYSRSLLFVLFVTAISFLNFSNTGCSGGGGGGGTPPPEPSVVCGNGQCETGETFAGCPADCLEGCGDGVCAEGEVCPADCVSGGGVVCNNDAVCGEGENIDNCPADCVGGGGGPPPVACGNAECAGDETALTCPADCVPAVPAGVIAAAGDAQVLINWNDVEGVSQYNLYWGESVDTVTNRIENVRAPYTHAGRTNGITYYYSVVAVDAAGESAHSEIANATPMLNLVGVVIEASASRELTMTWTDVEGAASYNIRWRGGDGSSGTIEGAVSPYASRDLRPGLEYFYSIEVLNADDVIFGRSEEVSGIPYGAAPNPVTIDSKFKVNWGEVDYAEGYRLYWRTTPDGDYALLTETAEGTAYVHHGCPFGVICYYVVRAVLGEYESGNSMEASKRAVEAKVLAGDGAMNDRFGYSVSIYGDTAVVGSYLADDAGEASGSAYLFVLRDGAWAMAAKLRASDAAAGNRFGSSVSVYGNTVLVGTEDSVGNGAAYIFVRPAAGWGGDLTETAKLTASDGRAGDRFGSSVSLRDDTVVVGAPFDDDGGLSSGSAYVFMRPAAGWVGALTQTAKLTADDGAASDNFGISVSVYKTLIIVGAAGNAGRGAAYLFARPGAAWHDMTQTAKLEASDGAAGDKFGYSVSINSELAVVGAYQNDVAGVADSGSAYLFISPAGGWVDMTQTAKLVAGDWAASDNFGISVSAGYNTIARSSVVIVGARNNGGNGAAYIFRRPAGGWVGMSHTAKLTDSDGAANDYFGSSVSMAENASVAIVGTWGDNGDLGENYGSASIFYIGE